MRIYKKEDIPQDYALASAYIASEFIDEAIDDWQELVKFQESEVLYFYNESEKYKHEIWMPQRIIDQLNAKKKPAPMIRGGIMDIKIPSVIFKEILYFLNDWLRLMGFGGEYRRLSRLIWELYKANAFRSVEMKPYRTINSVIENFKRIEKIEKDR